MADIINHEHQQAWDTALLYAWRSDANIGYLIWRWETDTGASYEQERAHLRRAPRPGMPFYVRVRVWVAEALPLISNRMWDQPAERDAALIAKLQTVGYTTQTQRIKTEADLAVERERRANRKSQERIKLSAHLYADRNHATDWGVTKSSKATRGRLR
jgi:hypothetical protein